MIRAGIALLALLLAALPASATSFGERWRVLIGEAREAAGNGELQLSAKLLQQALRAAQRMAVRHDEVAITLNDVGVVALKSGDVAKAERSFARAEQYLERDDDRFEVALVAEILGNRGELARASGRLAEAELLQRRALALKREHYGAAHPALVPPLRNLLAVLLDAKRFDAAAEVYRELAPLEPAPALAYSIELGLGQEAFGAEDYAAAADHFEALAVLEPNLALADEDRVASLLNRLIVAHANGDRDTAVALALRAREAEHEPIDQTP